MDNKKIPHKVSFKNSPHFSGTDHLLSINQAVIITDFEGTINFWNKAAVALYQWTAKEAIGRNIIDLVPSKQTKEQGIEIMKLLSKGQSWSGEFIVQRKNGSYFPAFVTDLPFYNEHNILSGVIGISSDMTAQKKSEREVRLLLNNTEESFILVDQQLNIIAFNKQANDLYKKHMGRELAKGLPILDFAKSKRIENLKIVYQKVLAGKSEESELIFDDNNGVEYIYSLKYKPARDESDQVFGVFITSRDVTDQKKAEWALMKNEARWQALIENIHDIFMIINPQGIVEYVSPSIGRILGYELDDLQNKNLHELFHTDDKNLINERLVRCLENPGMQLQVEKSRIKNKDG